METQLYAPEFDPNISSKQIRQQRSTNDYRKLSQYEQILERPDMWIGDLKRNPRNEWVFDPTNNKLIMINTTLPRAIERLFLEIISNSADNIEESRRMGIPPGGIEITISEGMIRIKNYGEPIPLIPKQGSTPNNILYIPSMIFSEFNSSSHYNRNVINMGIGKNGVGSKLTNTLSRMFTVKCGDAKNGQEWCGRWEFNLRRKTHESITPGYVYDSRSNSFVIDTSKPRYTGPSYVEIEYFLDFPYFGYNESKYTIDAVCLFHRYSIDFGFTCKIPILFNGVNYNYQNLQQYASLFWDNETIASAFIHYEWEGGNEPEAFKKLTKAKKHEFICNPSNPSMIPIVEIMCLDTPDKAVCLSFVNGMMTPHGGIHVDTCYAEISQHLLEEINNNFIKKNLKNSKDDLYNKLRITAEDLKRHISIIISCRLPDPQHDSQSKTRLAGPKPRIKIEPKSINISKWKLLDRLYNEIETKMVKSSKGLDKKVKCKNGRHAIEAGGRLSNQCVVYIGEGISVTGYQEKRISMLKDENKFNGFMPLKGKIINVQKANIITLYKNEELRILKSFLGLRDDVDYNQDSSISQMKYGFIICNTDADTDGVHIRSLLLNFFHSKYKAILRNGMFAYLRTFAVKLKDRKSGKFVARFVTAEDFKNWEVNNPDHGYDVYYYKGLAQCDDECLVDDISNASIVICTYDSLADEAINTAFSDGNSDLRKVWMEKWRQKTGCEDITVVTINGLLKSQKISDLINYGLVGYTIDSLFRAIPSVYDGLKKSQRQALYYMLKKYMYGLSTAKPDKVVHLASSASADIHYHHGPVSLMDTMIKMAQDFVGTNNLNYFMRSGQFGTRSNGGKNAGDPRYCMTKLEWWIKLVVQKEMVDLVEKRLVEGEEAEPIFIPMDLPMHLINGTEGVATGYSSSCPSFSLLGIIRNLVDRCCGNTPTPLFPAFKGFKGKLEMIDRKSKTKESVEKEILNPEIDENDEEDEISEKTKEIILAENAINCPKTLVTYGVFNIVNTHADGSMDIHISELPIRRWTNDYDNWLDEEIVKKGYAASYVNSSVTEVDGYKEGTINFLIKKFNHPEGATYDTLKLKKSFGMSNITLIDNNGYPLKYKTADEVMDVYYQNMIIMYNKLRQSRIDDRLKKIYDLDMCQKYVQSVKSGMIDHYGDEKDIEKQMLALNIPFLYYNKIKGKHFSKNSYQDYLNKVAKLRQEIEEIKSRSAERMWYDRLIKIHEEFVKKGYNF